MTKMSKRKLIELTRKYVDVPCNERQIEYKSYGGFYEIRFYTNVLPVHINVPIEYLITVKYTVFLGEETLEIVGMETSGDDYWRKLIRI